MMTTKCSMSEFLNTSLIFSTHPFGLGVGTNDDLKVRFHLRLCGGFMFHVL